MKHKLTNLVYKIVVFLVLGGSIYMDGYVVDEFSLVRDIVPMYSAISNMQMILFGITLILIVYDIIVIISPKK